jgi:hypothetical protein
MSDRTEINFEYVSGGTSVGPLIRFNFITTDGSARVRQQFVPLTRADVAKLRDLCQQALNGC